jgi:hypothetical protein
MDNKPAVKFEIEPKRTYHDELDKLSMNWNKRNMCTPFEVELVKCQKAQGLGGPQFPGLSHSPCEEEKATFLRCMLYAYVYSSSNFDHLELFRRDLRRERWPARGGEATKFENHLGIFVSNPPFN